MTFEDVAKLVDWKIIKTGLQLLGPGGVVLLLGLSGVSKSMRNGLTSSGRSTGGRRRYDAG